MLGPPAYTDASGEVAERSKAAVLKTAKRKLRGFESHPLRHTTQASVEDLDPGHELRIRRQVLAMPKLERVWALFQLWAGRTIQRFEGRTPLSQVALTIT